VVITAFLIDSVGIETCLRRTSWSAQSSLLPNTAPTWLSLFTWILVLVVSLSPQSRQPLEAPIQVAHPGIQFEHRSQTAMVDQAELAGVAGE
jgi:hypothetical protein